MARYLYQNRIPDDHQDFAVLYNNLAMLLCDGGKLDEALGYHLRALNIRNKFQNNDHIELSETYNNIATVFFAKAILKRLLNIRLWISLYWKKTNPVHPYLKQLYQKMASYYSSICNMEKTKLYHEKVQAIPE